MLKNYVPAEHKTEVRFDLFIDYKEPAHGTCICGEEVSLWDQYYGACECPKCGRWYNLFGQELVAPEHWETDPAEEEYW